MRQLSPLFESNRRWVERHTAADPEYFERMAASQAPPYMWIGCSDSRIPANEIVGLEAGELFVHRNVANLVVHTDFNVLSALEFAIDVLRIRHIIVCGHFGCGGVLAAMKHEQYGLLDNWLRHIRDVYASYKAEIDALESAEERCDRLVELNTVDQALNVCHTSIVQNAWARGQALSVHGWVYDLRSGLLRDMNCCITSAAQIDDVYRAVHPRGQSR